MPTPQPTRSPYRTYRSPTSGQFRDTNSLDVPPVGTQAVPKKTDLVSPQYTHTQLGNTRTASSRAGSRPASRTVAIQKTKQVVVSKRRVINESSAAKQTLKGGAILFGLVLGLVILKDLFDLVSLALDAIGAGLTATVVGSVIGVPLAILSEVLNKFGTLVVDVTVLFYFWFTGGKFALRLVVMSIGAIIDAVPVLNTLPITTITFVIAFVVGRAISKVESNLLGGAATSVIAKRI